MNSTALFWVVFTPSTMNLPMSLIPKPASRAAMVGMVIRTTMGLIFPFNSRATMTATMANPIIARYIIE